LRVSRLTSRDGAVQLGDRGRRAGSEINGVRTGHNGVSPGDEEHTGLFANIL